MSKIIRLLSNGASFAAGFVAGRLTLTDDDVYTGDVWTGETHTMRLEADEAEQWLERVRKWQRMDWDEWRSNRPDKTTGVVTSRDNPFRDEDYKDLEMKLSHGLSDADDGENIEFEVTDRQRLLIFDSIMAGPPDDEMPQIR